MKSESSARFTYGHLVRKKSSPQPNDEKVTRVCVVCGAAFGGTRSAKLCSAECKAKRKSDAYLTFRKKND